MKSGMAMGSGWALPWVTSTCSAAKAGEASSTPNSDQGEQEFLVIATILYWPIICLGSNRKGLISCHSL